MGTWVLRAIRLSECRIKKMVRYIVRERGREDDGVRHVISEFAIVSFCRVAET